MAQIGIKQAGNTLHTGLHTHIDEHSRHRHSGHTQPGHKMRKICKRGGMAREGWSVCVSVSLFGGEQHDTQVLFWSIKSMRGNLGKEANLSVL